VAKDTIETETQGDRNTDIKRGKEKVKMKGMEDGCRLVCRKLPTFQRYFLPPSSSSTRLHGATTQKTAMSILAFVRTSNPTKGTESIQEEKRSQEGKTD
jgi:hypothetical protein